MNINQVNFNISTEFVPFQNQLFHSEYIKYDLQVLQIFG